jgi:hypothetical protein
MMHEHDFPELMPNPKVGRFRMWLPVLVGLGSGMITGAAIRWGGDLRIVQAGSTVILGLLTIYWMFAARAARCRTMTMKPKLSATRIKAQRLLDRDEEDPDQARPG